MINSHHTPDMLPEPKYQIGDVVYYARVDREIQRLPCPDCKDTGVWTLTTPAGDTYTVECLRCRRGNIYDVPGNKIATWVPKIQEVTVGSIEVNTAREKPVRYMCKETGIGSGQVYDEEELFTQRHDAQLYAEIKASRYVRESPLSPTDKLVQSTGLLRFTDAFVEKARSSVFHSWYKYNQFVEDVQDVLKNETTYTGLKSALESAMLWETDQRDPHPVNELIESIKSYLNGEHDSRTRLEKALTLFPDKENHGQVP